MNNLSVIKEPIVKEMEVFDRLFDDSLTSDNALLDSVFGHLRSRKGKLMRPQLFMLTGKIFGDIDMRGMHAALALELLHTASLIHDDVVDNSDMRRGQASVNKMFDNKRAVLSGDYVLATALKHAAMSANIRVVNEISALGQALSEGEVMQLEKSMSEELSEPVYMSVIERKTAALFSTCTCCASVMCGASDEDIKRMTDFGHCVGMAFQIRDDIFDYYEDAAIGKPTGNDMREGKITLPAIYALREAADGHALEMLHRIKSGEASAGDISAMVDFTRKHGGIDYAERIMNDFHARAVDLLSFVGNADIKKALVGYAGFVVGRSY